MRFRNFLILVLSFGIFIPLHAQEWSPYVPGQVSYFSSKSGDQNIYGVRALDTMIERDTYKVYYFKSGVWPCHYHGQVDCNQVHPPDSMIYSNGTYLYQGKKYFFDETVGTAWKETNIPINPINEYTDTVTFHIDSIFVDTIFGIVDSFKSISRSFPGASPLIISKKFGLVKGDLRMPYHDYDPEYGLHMSFFYMPDSLIGIENTNTPLGEVPPKAIDFFPYRPGTKLKWDHYHYETNYHSTWESIDSIISIDTTPTQLIVHHQTIAATENGLDTTLSETTYGQVFLNKIIHNQMNYYHLDCSDSAYPKGYKIEVLEKDTFGPEPYYYNMEFYNIRPTGIYGLVDTSCQFHPAIYNKGYVTKETYSYNGRYGFKLYDYYSFIGWPASGISDGVQLIAYQSATDSFGEFSTPKYVLGMEEVPAQLKVKVYPNPATNLIRMSTPHASTKVRYKVYSSLGRIILTGTFTDKTTLDISSLPNGIYFIELVGDEQRAVRKLVKQ